MVFMPCYCEERNGAVLASYNIKAHTSEIDEGVK